MAKNTAPWFKHDYNARGDERMAKLQKEEGMAGVGLYWCIVEKLYEAGGRLKLDPGTIAFDLKVKVDLVTRLLSAYDLFASDEQNFWSDRVLTGLKDRKAKTVKAKKSANERWNKGKHDATALRPHCEGNAIREEKRREDESRGEKKEVAPLVVLPFDTDTFLNAWNEWIQFRIQLRKKIVPSTAKKQLKFLARWPEEIAIKIINQSIEKGWTGLFEVKQEYSNTQKNERKNTNSAAIIPADRGYSTTIG